MDISNKKRKPKKILYAMRVVLTCETAAAVYFGMASLPQNLVDQEQQVDKQENLVDTEIKRIDLQHNEHQYPVEALSALLTFKPQNCGFNSITIGEYPNGDWIKIAISSTDAASINGYTDSLSANDFFKNLTVSNLQTTPTGATAEIVIKKGDGK